MAKMKFTSPKTQEEQNYFARSAGLRFWAGLLVLITPMVWGVVDYMGLAGLIMPHNPTVSTIFTVLLLMIAHGILIASAMMAGYDIFDNDKVESPVLAILPVALAAGLLYFSWQGAENLYLEHYAHKAVEQKTDDLDAKLTTYTTATNQKFDKQKADVKEAKALARKSVRSRFSNQMASAQRLAVHDDADRKWRNKKIADVNRDIDNAIATIDNAEAAELAEIAKNAASEAKSYSDTHSTETASIANKNKLEREKEQSDKQKAEGKGFWFSLGLCGLFFLSVLARTRTDCKSGIIPVFEHTDGDKSDRVRETMYVFNAIFGSQYSRLLAWLHDLGATEYREITPIRQKPLVAAVAQQDPTPPTTPFSFTVNPSPLGIAAKATPIGFNRTQDGNVKSVVKPPVIPNIHPSPLLKFKELKDEEVIEMMKHLNFPIGLVTEFLNVCREFNPVMEKVGMTAEDKKIFAPIEVDIIVKIAESSIAVKEAKLWNDGAAFIPNPTPSVTVTKTPVSTTEPPIQTVAQLNPVAQPMRTVPQPKPEKITSLLDDKLLLLRSKILKYSESHFQNSQANDGTVSKAIFRICDEAYMALRKDAKVQTAIVNDFQTAVKTRLQLCQDNGFEYDSFEELMNLLDKRKEGSND